MAVNIQLDSRYSITADHLQWVLLLDQRPHWFFPDLVYLLKEYLNVKSRECNVREATQLIHYQTQLLERLMQCINTNFKQLSGVQI